MAESRTNNNFVGLSLSLRAEQRPHEARAIAIPISCLIKVGMAEKLLNNHKDSRRIEDLEQGISSFREALTLCPSESPLFDKIIKKVSITLQSRYLTLRNAERLEDCISFHLESLSLHPPNHPHRPTALSDLASALKIRYDRSVELEDLEQSISLLRDALNLCAHDHPDRPGFLNNLASALSTRYKKLGKAEDLEESILLHRDALNLCRPGRPGHSISLNNLATALNARYDKLGNAKDLEESISLNRDALCLRPPGHPDRSMSLNNLAMTLKSRYDNMGNAQDLEDSILFNRDALRLCPPRHPDHSSVLNNLATALKSRYDKLGDAKDLEDSVLFLSDALNLCPPGHPGRCISLNNLATALNTRYNKLGNPKDLEESILLHRNALNLRPPGHPHRAMSLNNLATALKTRYDKLGNAEDLEDSISLHRDVLNLYPPHPPHHSISHNNLAAALKTRYDKLGNPEDLDDSISLYHDALRLCPPRHTDYSNLLNNLAAALSSRYDKLGNAEDLEDSISMQRQALSLRPPGHPGRSISLNNLANALDIRYKKFGDAEDLEDSILLHRDALRLCPLGHPDRSGFLNNLATALNTRYDKLGNTEDLENSISFQHEAVSLRTPGHPHASMLFCQLGISLVTRSVQSSKTEDLLQAFVFFGLAASDSTSYIHDRLRAATHWVNFAQTFKHESVFLAVKTLLQLLNRSLIFHPSVESQQRFLARADIPRSLVSDAASVAIQAGRIELAVEFLEQGRALLWSRVDAYKSPLQQLQQAKGGKKLAARLQTLSANLEHLSLGSSSAISKQEVSGRATILDSQMKEHRLLSEEWEYLVGKAREIEGFSNFLQVAPFDVLQSAAAEGPVILVNISQYRSDGIILLKDGTPELVNLPEVLVPELRGQKCGSPREIANTLAYLWDHIVLLIVNRLNELGVPKHSRIWWCPTAELCALPLHAAGRGKKNLQEIYVSSYTSTLSSLIRARSNIIQQHTIPRLLVVGQPANDLKRAIDEVDIIKKLRPDVEVLFGPEANRELVLRSLKDHSWVHFACHGVLGDKDQPFHASFKLHEDPKRRLLLLDLMRARLPNAELAFLSVCHSAAGGLSTPDESIHLSAALQSCGFKSVVGTLWEMADEDGPMISEKFYSYMFRNPDKIDFKNSAYALRSAIKQLAKAKVPLHRLAMFVHIGA